MIYALVILSIIVLCLFFVMDYYKNEAKEYKMMAEENTEWRLKWMLKHSEEKRKHEETKTRYNSLRRRANIRTDKKGAKNGRSKKETKDKKKRNKNKPS